MPDNSPSNVSPTQVSAVGCALVLITAFLGWMFAGVVMSLLIAATRPAIHEFLATDQAGTALAIWDLRSGAAESSWEVRH